jgi:hypothetical protein
MKEPRKPKRRYMYSSYGNSRGSDSDDDKKKEEEVGDEKCEICQNDIPKSRFKQHKQICLFMKEQREIRERMMKNSEGNKNDSDSD